MKWHSLNLHGQQAKGLVSDYELTAHGHHCRLEIDAHYSPQSEWSPPIEQKFADEAAALDFMEKFEAAMLRQSARGYFRCSNEFSARASEVVYDGIFARLDRRGQPSLFQSDAKEPAGPHAGADCVPMIEVPVSLPHVYFKPLRGLRMEGRECNADILFVTRDPFDRLAYQARDAVLDAQVLDRPLTPLNIRDVLSRAFRRYGCLGKFESVNPALRMGNEIILDPSDGFHSVKPAEIVLTSLSDNNHSRIALSNDRAFGFRESPEGGVTLTLYKQSGIRRERGSDLTRLVPMHSEAFGSRGLFNLVKVICDKAQNPFQNSPEVHRAHIDLVASASSADLEALLNPKKKLSPSFAAPVRNDMRMDEDAVVRVLGL